MMKYILTILTLLAFITTGCDKKATNSDDDNETMEYSTVNIKTATEYFNFATNSGSTDENSAHDFVFYSVSWSPPGSPVTIKDPRFRCQDGLSVAVINAAELSDVTDVPSTSNFVTNFVSEFGEWYNEDDNTHVISPQDKVYIVNTTDEKFPAFKILSYYDERGVSGVFSIEWKYLND